MSEKRSSKRAAGKTILIIIVVLFALLCLVPFPSHIKDGGSTYYRPFLPVYGVTRWNGFGHSEGFRTAGVTLEIFGAEVYSSFHEEPAGQ